MILLKDRLIVRPDKAEEKTEAGIILATASVGKNIKRGIVEEVGTDVKHVKKDDKIVYSPFHYDQYTDETIIIAEEDVWAILNR